jgi:hypothetical protein
MVVGVERDDGPAHAHALATEREGISGFGLGSFVRRHIDPFSCCESLYQNERGG